MAELNKNNSEPLIIDVQSEPVDETVIAEAVEGGPDDTLKSEAGRTKVEKNNSEISVEIWNERMKDLNEALKSKRQIELQLSELYEKDGSERDADEIKKLEAEKIIAAKAVLEKGCAITREDPVKKREEVEAAQANEWKKTLESAFGGVDYAKKEQALTEHRLREKRDEAITREWSKLPDSTKRKYGGDIHNFYKLSIQSIYRKTADDNGENGIIITPGAFCEMINQGYNPEDVDMAGGFDTTKYALKGLKNLAGFDTVMKVAKEGGLVSIPRANKPNEVMTFKEINDLVSKLEKDFNDRISNSAKSEIAVLATKTWEDEANKTRYMDAIEGIELNKAIQKMRNQIFEMQREMMSEDRMKELEVKREADRKVTPEMLAKAEMVTKKSRGRPKKVEAAVEPAPTPAIENLVSTGTELPSEQSFQPSVDDSEEVNPKTITSDDFNAYKILEWEKENGKNKLANSLNQKKKVSWFSKIFNRIK